MASHKLEGHATQTPVSHHSVEDKIEEKRYRRLQNRLDLQQQIHDQQLKSYLKQMNVKLQEFLQMRKEGYEKFPSRWEFKEEWFFQTRKEERHKLYKERMYVQSMVLTQAKRDGTLTVKSLYSLFAFLF